MRTKTPLLLSSRIYLLRFVVPLCIASLLLLLSGPLLWKYEELMDVRYGLPTGFPQHWFALGGVSFTLAHHLLL